MNRKELSILKKIDSDILKFVKNIQIARYQDALSFKIYVPFKILEKILETYDNDEKVSLKENEQYQNEYPVRFVIHNRKYMIYFYNPYLKSKVNYVRCFVKDMRLIDNRCFKILKKIQEDDLFQNLEILIDGKKLKEIINV